MTSDPDRDRPRPEPTATAAGPPPRRPAVAERLLEAALLCCGLAPLLVTLAVAAVLAYGSLAFFAAEDGRWLSAGATAERVRYFFTGGEWVPGHRYGVWPLLVGTLSVAAVAAAVAVPVGLGTAVYLGEYAGPRLRDFARPTLGMLAGVPTVLYGLFAVTAVTPLLALVVPGLDTPHSRLGGGVVVGIMIVPMVTALSQDALAAVPRSLRDAAFALGATRFEVATRVALPAALPGVAGALLLALGRAVGETMAVSLACGGRPALTLDPREGAATMTSYIVHAARGGVRVGSTDFHSLCALAALLLALTLAANVTAQRLLARSRRVYP